MGKKGNTAVILLVILIGAVCGVGLLMGINNAVNSAISPLNAKLAEIERAQKSIEMKLNTQGGSNNNLYPYLSAIQSQLAQLQNKIGSNGFGGGQQPQPQQPPAEDMNKVYTIPEGVSPILGNRNAPVTIVEFSDFQCPFCARFYSAIKDVMAAYPGRVRVMVKNFPLPFHPNARPAAKLAMAANEQGKFQGMMEALLANG